MNFKALIIASIITACAKVFLGLEGWLVAAVFVSISFLVEMAFPKDEVDWEEEIAKQQGMDGSAGNDTDTNENGKG